MSASRVESLPALASSRRIWVTARVMVWLLFFLRLRFFFSSSEAFWGFWLTGASILLQSSQYLFCFAFGTSAPVEPRAEAGDHGNKVAHQVVLGGVGCVHYHQCSPLHGQQGLDVSDPKAGGSIFMLDDNPPDLSVCQQGQKLGALIIDATAALFHDFGDRPPLRVAPGDQSFCLGVKVLFVLARRHPCVDSHKASPRWLRHRFFDRLLNDHGAGRELIASDLPSLKQPVGRVVVDAKVLGVTRQLHRYSISYEQEFCKR